MLPPTLRVSNSGSDLAHSLCYLPCIVITGELTASQVTTFHCLQCMPRHLSASHNPTTNFSNRSLKNRSSESPKSDQLRLQLVWLIQCDSCMVRINDWKSVHPCDTETLQSVQVLTELRVSAKAELTQRGADRSYPLFSSAPLFNLRSSDLQFPTIIYGTSIITILIVHSKLHSNVSISK